MPQWLDLPPPPPSLSPPLILPSLSICDEASPLFASDCLTAGGAPLLFPFARDRPPWGYLRLSQSAASWCAVGRPLISSTPPFRVMPGFLAPKKKKKDKKKKV